MRAETPGTAVSVFKKLIVATMLGSLCFIVGASCVVLPPPVPLGVVGLAILLLLWTLPDLYTPPRPFIVKFYFVAFCTTICVPFYLAIVIPGLPWIGISRTAGLSFTALFTLTLAASSKTRAEVLEVMRAWPVMYYVLIAYVANYVATTVISVQIATSVTELLNATLGLWIPFLAAVWVVRTPAQVMTVLRLSVYCLFVITIIGGIEFYLHRGFLIYLIPAGMRATMIEQNPMLIGMETGSQGLRNGLYRAVSIFTSGLLYGEFAAMIAPVATFFLVHGQTGKARLFGFAGLLCACASVVFSGSRGGYVGLLASLIVFGMLYAVRRTREHPESLAGMIAVVLGAMGSVAVIGAVLTIHRVTIFVLGGGAAQASNDGRTMEWALAKPLIYANPFGHGPGTATKLVGFLSSSGAPTLDSYPINLLVDTGVLGLIFFFSILALMLATCFWGYFKGVSDLSTCYLPLGCSLVAYTLYRFNLSQTANNDVVFPFLACTFAIRYIERLANVKAANIESRSAPLGDRPLSRGWAA